MEEKVLIVTLLKSLLNLDRTHRCVCGAAGEQTAAAAVLCYVEKQIPSGLGHRWVGGRASDHREKGGRR